MIYIVANRPKKNEQREGFLQRVQAIDGLLVDEERVYEDDFDTPEDRKNAMLVASAIYVHSVYNAEKIIDWYPLLGHKIITDMHGVVPEEERFLGNTDTAKRMGEVEAEVLGYGAFFIGVTSAMVDHFIQKYAMKDAKQWIVLPIFNDGLQSSIQHKTRNTMEVVYSGGAQKWQNCEQMVKSFGVAEKKTHLTILSNDVESFRELLGRHPGAEDSITLCTVANSKIAEHYDKSDMGFVLRDDNVINKVACPTKIIEYIKRGVVPIVKYEDIGDFKKLGYRYVKCADFEKGKYTSAQLNRCAVRNLEVLSKLESISKNGIRELVTIIANLRASDSISQRQTVTSQKYIENLTKIEQLQSELEKERNNVQAYIQALQEKEEVIQKLLNSKRWRFGEALNSPRRILAKIQPEKGAKNSRKTKK